MRTVALGMNDRSHAETHYLCEQANLAQQLVRFRDVFLGDDPFLAAPRVHVVEAMRHFNARKREFQLGPDDVLIAVVQGNLFDEHNDEYLFRTNTGVPELGDSCSSLGVMSLFYRLDSASEFLNPQSAAARHRKAEWWDPKSELEKAMLLANSSLLMILGLVATVINGLREHSDTRGCIMDYCQDPYDMLEAFKRGVEFRFCQRACRRTLESTAEGQGLLKAAERLAARPFAQPQPSIFLSYARDDFERSERLLVDLQSLGYEKVWKDVYEIVGGVEWEPEIRSAMEKHHFVVSCLSNAGLARPRFFRQELDVALGLHAERKAHLIPVRLDDCQLPSELRPYHYIDLFPDWELGLEAVRHTITRSFKPFERASER